MHAISSLTGEGLDDVRALLAPGLTAVLLGSSGVGKSTLVNTLAGEELLATQEIRDDGKGRHTTTHRELVQLPTGALMIDTPGIRELQLWVADDGIDEAFEDITELFAHCRFSDCAHDTRARLRRSGRARGRHARADRWDSYLKLQAELAHLERKLDKRAASEARKKWKAISAEGSANMRSKGNKSREPLAPRETLGRRERPPALAPGVFTLAAPGVGVVVNDQSVAALFVSVPSGKQSTLM